MEKHENKDQASLLSEFYKEEECSSSSTATPPPELESQDDVLRPGWARAALCYVKCALLQALSLLLSAVAVFIPSFIPKHGSSTEDSGRGLSPTAYLDGLRGIACFIVYLVHFIVNWYPALRNSYGASPTDHHFFQLPIIRVIWEGQSAVASFFVISGYAVSYRALSKIHSGDTTGVLETLSSSTFRRCMRLYLPCAANTLICMFLRYFDLFTPDPLRWNTLPPKYDTFSAQLWDWWANQKIFMYPFSNVEGDVYSPPYNGHLWTIPLEIRGSFVVYGTVLAVAKLKPFWRSAFLIIWDGYLYYMGKWDLFLFVGGALLANLDMPRHAKVKKAVDEQIVPDAESLLPTSESSMETMRVASPPPQHHTLWFRTKRSIRLFSVHFRKFAPAVRVFRAIIPYVLFFFALFLLGDSHETWAFRFIPDSFNPLGGFFGGKDQGIRVVGSVMLAYSLSLSAPTRAPAPPSTDPKTPQLVHQTFLPKLLARIRAFTLQSLFTNTFSQYLGRVSFGFYLMHGPVLFCIGTKFLVPAWSAFYDGDHNLGKYIGQFALACLVNTLAIFWAADVFARAFDEPSVKLASKIARFMSRKKGSGS